MQHQVDRRSAGKGEVLRLSGCARGPQVAARDVACAGGGAGRSGAVKVLLVDDDAEHSELMRQALSAAGMQTALAVDEGECLQTLRRDKSFDVIVINCDARRGSGLQVLASVRRAGHYIPVIMLVSSGSQRVAVTASQAGAAEYLLKEKDLSHLRILAQAVERLTARRGGARDWGVNQGAQVPDAGDLVLVDPLTGLYNRAFFDTALRQRFDAARRTRSPLACAIGDVDRFRQVNEAFGRMAGDDVLAAMAAMMRANFRSSDLLFRYGGEEFAVLMPATDVDAACTACRRLLQRLEDHGIDTAAGPVKVTLGIGLAAYVNDNYRTAADLFWAADTALCAAKRAGRNQLVVADGSYQPANEARVRLAA